MRILITLLLQIGGQDIEETIRQLGAEDYQDREQAMQVIAKLGQAAEAKLRPNLNDSDPEIAARVDLLLQAIEWSTRRKRLVFDVTLDGGDHVVTLTNNTRWPFLFLKGPWSGFNISPKYSDGTRMGSAGGRWSNHGTCVLSEDDFVELGPGQTMEVARVKPVRDAAVVSIHSTYSYTPREYTRNCNRTCRHHDNPAWAWNRALDIHLAAHWKPDR